MRFLVLIVAVTTLCACAQPASDVQESRQALVAANEAYDQALIKQDAAALERFYADDFQIIDDDAVVHSKSDQIRFMTTQLDLLEAKTDDFRIRMLGPDAALLTGRFSGRYRMNGKEADFVERYTSVWTRQGKDWRLTHATFEHRSEEITPNPNVRTAATR